MKTLPLPFYFKQSLRYIYSAIPERKRYGKAFWDTCKLLQESQWWSKEELKDYQMQQLNRLLKHAYENVPYYRKLFDERGLRPKDIQDFGDVKQIPYLTKDIVRVHLNDLRARNYPNRKFQYVTTGGSTGTPLGFYYERGVSIPREWAFMVTQWKRIGFTLGDKRVILRGNVVRSADQDSLWEYNPIDKSLILSSVSLTDRILPIYIKKINEFQPDFLHVYPSSAFILARFMKTNNLKPFPSIKAVLCGSESIFPWQRTLLEEVFRCRVYSWYGHSELCALAGQCEKNSSYHVFPEYGFVEFMDQNKDDVKEDEKSSEIIATGFNNYAMPFIRYKTGDMAVYSKDQCSCGRNYPLIKGIRGRMQDFIISKSNHLVPLSAVQYERLGENNFVRQFQFYQDKPGEVIVYIVKAGDFLKKEEAKIHRVLQEGIGKDILFSIKFTEDIHRTQSGKQRLLIQKLPNDLYQTNPKS